LDEPANTLVQILRVSVVEVLAEAVARPVGVPGTVACGTGALIAIELGLVPHAVERHPEAASDLREEHSGGGDLLAGVVLELGLVVADLPHRGPLEVAFDLLALDLLLIARSSLVLVDDVVVEGDEDLVAQKLELSLVVVVERLLEHLGQDGAHTGLVVRVAVLRDRSLVLARSDLAPAPEEPDARLDTEMIHEGVVDRQLDVEPLREDILTNDLVGINSPGHRLPCVRNVDVVGHFRRESGRSGRGISDSLEASPGNEAIFDNGGVLLFVLGLYPRSTL